MDDISGMDTSRKSRSGEEPDPQDEPLKETEGPLKNKTTSKTPGKTPQDETQESPVEDEEPGTFDRVYEHGRQMGF